MHEALARHYFFSGWPDEDLRALGRATREQVAAHGERLFMEEEPCHALFLLIEGRVCMERSRSDGRVTTLATIGPGGLVGCAALFLGGVFPATARVVSPQARLLVVSGKALLGMLDRRPQLARGLIGALAERLMMISARMEGLQSSSTVQRLARWLIEQPSGRVEGGRVVRLEGSRRALAASLGMTPESLSRAQANLVDRGVLTVTRKEFKINHDSDLIDIAEGMDDSD